jgi:hypothetical protein
MTKLERAAYDKTYKEKNKKQIKLWNKSYYKRNRRRLLEYQRKYHKAHALEMHVYHRDYYRFKSYGIDKETFDKMLQTQNNKCEICGTEFDLGIKWRSPHVDHDHATGKVRSLLCQKCNLGLGNFQENPNFLVKAAEYLKYQVV